ncbi:MAG: hypothetical protein WD059_13300 [Balneolaceae bacterium]
MESKNFINVENSNAEVSLDLIEFIEDNVHLVYSPALDLTGYGDNKKEARTSFEVTLKEFLRYTIKNNTLDKELKRLGWKKQKKSDHSYTPPELTKLSRKNRQLKHILNHQEFEKTTQRLAFA